MPRTTDPYFLIPVNTTNYNIFCQNCMNILFNRFIQYFSFRNALFNILIRLLVIDNFIYFTQFFSAYRYCSRSKFLSKLLKTFDKTFREIFPVFISTKRREKPSAFFDNNFVNNAYFSEAASSSSSHLASSSSKAPISSRMTCLCLWSS